MSTNGPHHMSSILPSISRKVAKESGVSSKVSLQRIYAAWVDIIGQDFAHKSIPVNITWKKEQKKTPFRSKSAQGPKAPEKTDGPQTVATLHILCASAVATPIMYQEHLILERLARNLGYTAIRHIAVKHENGLDIRLGGALFKPNLNAQDKDFLADVLGGVEDQSLKALLYRLGEKILLDKRG